MKETIVGMIQIVATAGKFYILSTAVGFGFASGVIIAAKALLIK